MKDIGQNGPLQLSPELQAWAAAPKAHLALLQFFFLCLCLEHILLLMLVVESEPPNSCH